jgi:glycosyltransferase involved in cell wall biosynthesis
MCGGLLLAKLLRSRLITEVNGWRRDELKLISKSRPAMVLSRLSCWCDEQEIKCSDHTVVVAAGIKEALRRDLNIDVNKISVIPNAANIELFAPMEGTKALLGLDPDSYYVGFVGILAPWQGIDYLVRSAPAILEKVPNVKFLLVGDGQDKERLVKLCDEKGLARAFIFTGEVPYANVATYINAMDVCISFRKGTPASPLKLYEYMVCMKPVIATDHPDYSFIVDHGAGCLIDPDNSDEVAASIVGLLEDEDMRQRMGCNGREYVLQNRSWVTVAEEVLDVIEKVARKNRT